MDVDTLLKLVEVDSVAVLLTDVDAMVVQVLMTYEFLFTLPYIRKVGQEG